MKKTYIQTDDQFEADLAELKELNPGFAGSVLIRLAVRSAAQSKFTIMLAGDSKTKTGMERKAALQPKDTWCGIFGGEMKEGVCSINKYETMPTGHVRKDKRSIALSAFPLERDDFRKSVLGHFSTVEEAEVAYKAKPLC